MNVLLAVKESGPVELSEINDEIRRLADKQSALLARRAVLEQLIAIAQAHDAPQLETA